MSALHAYRLFPHLLLLILLPAAAFFPQSADGQVVLGAREVALGGAVTVLADNHWALFANPALSDTSAASLSFFGMRYYGFGELTDMAAAFHLPTGAGTWSAAFYKYGFELYEEQQFRAGWSYRLGRLRFGFSAVRHQVSLDGAYGTAGTWTVDVGLAAEIVPQLLLGMRAANPGRSSYPTAAGHGEPLYMDLSVGFSYRASGSLLFLFDLVKEPRYTPRFRGGLEFQLLPGLVLRTGADSRPGALSAGLGYRAGRWSINLAVQRHPDPLLGYSPGADMKLFF